ncbi:MAG: sel1 repeat family protein [Alphaproteobacteria bacterium]|nr:MAG: sel1 repeat family protein [Alphaproteobacteria bacterium]
MSGFNVDFIEKYLASADAGVADDQYKAGLLFSTGDGVDQDLVTAHKWFNLAAMNGVEAARENRAEISMDMSAQEIARAQKMAREWMMGR